MTDYKNVKIHPTATVDDGAQIGEGTQVWHYVHVRGSAKIGKNCRIGKSSSRPWQRRWAKVERGEGMGKGTKIQPQF